MAQRKRKTLPKNFDALLDSSSLDELIAVFDICGLEATGGYSKRTALGFYNCPDELARWLVSQGADVNAGDTYGETPLHHRAASWKGGVEVLLALGADIAARDRRGNTPLHGAARSHKPENARALIQHGADINASNNDGLTPLGVALAATRNADIRDTAAIAKCLLSAGAQVDDNMRTEVARIGGEFEFHRAGFNPVYLAKTKAGLATLYRLFKVAPAAPRLVHDGVSPIVVTATRWTKQHEELWQLLVPSQGAAPTVQGEAVRISGRIAHEILDNGAVNWDADFKSMLDALIDHLRSATPLPPDALTEAEALVKTLRSGNGDNDEINRLSELVVRWVIANPAPMPLPSPAYRR